RWAPETAFSQQCSAPLPVHENNQSRTLGGDNRVLTARNRCKFPLAAFLEKPNRVAARKTAPNPHKCRARARRQIPSPIFLPAIPRFSTPEDIRAGKPQRYPTPHY